MLTIGIDIDDTITNSTRVVRKYINKYSNSEELKNNIEGIIRGIYVSEESKVFYKKYSKQIGNNIKVKKNAKEIINKLYDEGYRILIVTARNNNYYDDAYGFSCDYLKRNGIKFHELFVDNAYKLKLCKEEKIDILIDDSVDIVNELYDNNINSLLFTSSINKNKKSKSKRVNNWLQVYDYIKGIS